MMFGCSRRWPHDGTQQSNERCEITRGTPVDGEELRLPFRAVMVGVYPPELLF